MKKLVDTIEQAISIKLVVSLQIDVIIGTEIFPYYVVQKLLNNSKISNKITLLEIRKVEEGYLVTVFQDGSLILVSSLQEAVDLGLKNHETDQLAESISIFYEKLVASQESLGAEFSSILHENLWDLYAR